ncbi:MAG: hypothetical protein LBU00_08250 [Treponema sp.]|nr:hypothetical protein [Treponema sp.]
MSTHFDYGVVDDDATVWGAKPGSSIPILRGAQAKYNDLPPKIFPSIADIKVSEARIKNSHGRHPMMGNNHGGMKEGSVYGLLR